MWEGMRSSASANAALAPLSAEGELEMIPGSIQGQAAPAPAWAGGVCAGGNWGNPQIPAVSQVGLVFPWQELGPGGAAGAAVREGAQGALPAPGPGWHRSQTRQSPGSTRESALLSPKCRGWQGQGQGSAVPAPRGPSRVPPAWWHLRAAFSLLQGSLGAGMQLRCPDPRAPGAGRRLRRSAVPAPARTGAAIPGQHREPPGREQPGLAHPAGNLRDPQSQPRVRPRSDRAGLGTLGRGS